MSLEGNTLGESDSRPNLIIRGLSKSFDGAQALDSVDLSVNYGEVHGLLGQNGSGKSTLIKILTGFHEPDGDAHVELGGRRIALPLTPEEIGKHGIAVVHQSLSLVPELSVVENLFVDRLVRNTNWAINWRKAEQDARALFRKYNLDISPETQVSDLPHVERALVAIIRAFNELDALDPSQSRLLILDEPTPFLAAADVERLFDLVRQLAVTGASVIFVSHDIDEVMELTDRATVLRNGRVAAVLKTQNSSRTQFIQAIVGRDVEFERHVSQAKVGAPMLSVRNLTAVGLQPFSIDARPGEVVGMTGLIGAGFDKVPYLLFGASAATGGSMELDGQTIPLSSHSADRAIARKIALIPADRLNEGIVPEMSAADNLALTVFGTKISNWFIRERDLKKNAELLIRSYDVRPARAALPLKSFSGGNQQKIVLAKWLQTNPNLILLDEPTQGVDVGARDQIYRLIGQAAKGGACVICASSDHEQLEAMCDRVLVFSHGKVVTELTGSDVAKAKIAESCFLSSEPELKPQSDLETQHG